MLSVYMGAEARPPGPRSSRLTGQRSRFDSAPPTRAGIRACTGRIGLFARELESARAPATPA